MQMEFAECIPIVASLAQEHTGPIFDIYLAQVLTDNHGVTLFQRYMSWKRHPENARYDNGQHLCHLLTMWHRENGSQATPSRFMEILGGMQETQLLLDKLAQRLQHAGINYNCAPQTN